MVGSSDGSNSGSAGLLLLWRFVLYRFWRLWVSDLSSRDIVVVIVAQKVKDACNEAERQYRHPHLPAGLLLAAMSRVDSYHTS
ncbi:hypothetical protein F511_34474 [Dorcoceras hygrometricum]|uniref:Uncharacterized protein n=1 Tax=Dorcoceras hygrometricum TaxID=472368 RepID=A0A2Z7BWQ2_9LAMI|nr:hypothetical protein F511_34474 [Dorcoceras hygrometricum]